MSWDGGVINELGMTWVNACLCATLHMANGDAQALHWVPGDVAESGFVVMVVAPVRPCHLLQVQTPRHSLQKYPIASTYHQCVNTVCILTTYVHGKWTRGVIYITCSYSSSLSTKRKTRRPQRWIFLKSYTRTHTHTQKKGKSCSLISFIIMLLLIYYIIYFWPLT